MNYSVALSQIKHLSFRLINEITIGSKSYEETYFKLKHFVNNSNTKTAEKIKKQINSNEPLIKADKILSDCNKYDIKIVNEKSNYYPKLLKECIDKPIVIYMKGEINPNERELISVVGTRNCTFYGLENCYNIISEMSNYKIGVVSGLAYGIDIKAHIEANKLNIPNYAVLGSGINNIYPKAHEKYAKEIMKNGMIISEYPPFTIPNQYNFPKRNRIIAGMTKSTIVIESSLKGGAMITAKLANDYNRDVFAIPGAINQTQSKGCNWLIFNHQAQLITHPKDFLGILGVQKLDLKKNKINQNKSHHNLYDFISRNPNSSFNKIQSQIDIPTSELNAILMRMEIEELILQLPGKIYTIL